MVASLLFYIACGEKTSDTALPADDQQPELQLDELSAGDLLITEIMVDPITCDDAIAEYVELKNTTERWININGLRIRDSANEYQVTNDVLIGPSTLVVGRINSNDNCFQLSAGFLMDLQWNNTNGDLIEISNSIGILDAVDFTTWNIPVGASLSLDPASFDVVSNDQEANWCAAPTPIANEYDDFGSPGTDNPSCSVID